MKNLKKLFCSVLVFTLAIISSVSSVYATSAPLGIYDSQIVNMSNEFASLTTYSNTDMNPFISANGGRYFSVEEPETDHFEIDVNGTEMTVLISDEDTIEPYQPQNITELNSKNIIDIVESSREKVENYIDESSILKDKEDIKDYIFSVGLKEAEFTDDPNVGAYFSASDSIIYVNRENSEYICEWLVCHEYMHAVSFYTHKETDLDNTQYAYSLYNKVLTDLLTCSLDPEINGSIESYYKGYYALIYPYINIFDIDAIDAYFYGYNTIYSKVTKPEFDFFVTVIENINEQNSEAYYNNLVLKWYAKNLA